MASGMPSRMTATETAAIVACRTRRRTTPASGLAGLEPEAHASHGGDVSRSVGVVAELPAQPRHVHVERLRRPVRVGAPDLPHQQIAADHGARLANPVSYTHLPSPRDGLLSRMP